MVPNGFTLPAKGFTVITSTELAAFVGDLKT